MSQANQNPNDGFFGDAQYVFYSKVWRAPLANLIRRLSGQRDDRTRAYLSIKPFIDEFHPVGARDHNKKGNVLLTDLCRDIQHNGVRWPIAPFLAWLCYYHGEYAENINEAEIFYRACGLSNKIKRDYRRYVVLAKEQPSVQSVNKPSLKFDTATFQIPKKVSPILAEREVEPLHHAIKGNDEEAIARIDREVSDKTGVISFSGLGIKYIPTNISRVPWVTDVDISETRISSFGWLVHLESIERLDISYVYNQFMPNFEECLNLRRIDCIDNTFLDFLWISRCKFIEVINCQRNESLRSLSGLESCKNIKTLICRRTSIRDIFPLKNLSKIVELSVDHTDLSTLDGLPNSDNLRFLDISSTQITSIAGIEIVPKLTNFVAKKNSIRSLDPLISCKKLNNINMDGSVIAYANPKLWFLESLKNVSLKGAKIDGVPSEVIQGDQSGNSLSMLREYYR